MSNVFKETILIALTAIAFIIAGYVTVDIEFMDTFGNASAVFDGLGWFVGLFAIATLFTAYLVIVAKIHFFLRFLAIPLWLVFTLSTIVTIDQFLGHAYPVVPPKAQALAYRIYLDGNTKMIEAWMAPDGKRTRLYKFEHTEEREEKLKEGQQATGEGIKMEIELRGDGSEDDIPFGRPVGEHIDHDIKHRGLPPKMEEPNR
jgi:hypothetical protein